MLAGFPVPDFDFDDDVPETVSITYQTPVIRRNADPCDMCDKIGLKLKSSTPLKDTGNSTVYAAFDANSGENQAVKITPKRRNVDEYEKRLVLPDSPYLVKTYGSSEISRNVILRMELCDSDIREIHFNETELIKLTRDIASALWIIHDNGYMHLDISPGNILKKGDRYKLADFGTLTPVGEFQDGCEGAGPYVSPEALAFPDMDVGCPTDIFSFGIVLLECATGKLAPRGGSGMYRKIRQGQVHLGKRPYECNIRKDMVDLINAMLEPEQLDRPSAEEIVSSVNEML